MNSHVGPDADSKMYTLELAQIYEKQGYNNDAHRIYAALDALESTLETKQGMDRTQGEKALPTQSVYSEETTSRSQKADQFTDNEDTAGPKKINALLEECFSLLNAKYRLNQLKKLKPPVL